MKSIQIIYKAVNAKMAQVTSFVEFIEWAIKAKLKLQVSSHVSTFRGGLI